MVDLAKRSKKEFFIFKVDFRKAYDSISSKFLEYMKVRHGFCPKWIIWIKACVFAGNLSFIVNCCPIDQVEIQKKD